MSLRFHNLDPSHVPHPLPTVLRWALWDRLTGRRRISPPGPPAPEARERRPWQDGTADRLLWAGHSSFLCRLGGASFLFDPVLGRRIGGAYRRYGNPGIRPEQLPPLDAVMISHNHYDHLDAPTLRRLPREVPILVPQGLGGWFRRRGHQRTIEMSWWQTVALDRLRVTFVPARHWSHRVPGDTNRSWWGGFVVEAAGKTVYHAGDSAAFSGFELIGQRFPGLDVALLPIGAYEPGWFMEHVHMTPEQAGEAFETLGAKSLVPMHWGTFQLTDEPISEPIGRLRAWWQAAGPKDGRALLSPAVGEVVDLA